MMEEYRLTGGRVNLAQRVLITLNTCLPTVLFICEVPISDMMREPQLRSGLIFAWGLVVSYTISTLSHDCYQWYVIDFVSKYKSYGR